MLKILWHHLAFEFVTKQWSDRYWLLQPATRESVKYMLATIYYWPSVAMVTLARGETETTYENRNRAVIYPSSLWWYSERNCMSFRHQRLARITAFLQFDSPHTHTLINYSHDISFTSLSCFLYSLFRLYFNDANKYFNIFSNRVYVYFLYLYQVMQQSVYSKQLKIYYIERICGIKPLNPELNPICYLLALLGLHNFLHVSRIRVKSLTLRLLMSYIYGAPILGVSRSHTMTQHSR